MYMDHAVGENETDMDLAEKQRAARILNLQRNQGLFMEHLTMKGKITPVFAREETLDLRIRVRTTQPLKNVMFRLTLRTDSDSGLGTFWSKPVDFPATGEQDMEMSMPLQLFEKGIFFMPALGFIRRQRAENHGYWIILPEHLRLKSGQCRMEYQCIRVSAVPGNEDTKSEEHKKKGDQL